MIIKNHTPYLGKIKIGIEKNPYDTGISRVNKIHLNFGFFKLVSRIYRTEYKGSLVFLPDPGKIQLIEKFTGGKIKDYYLEDSDITIPNSFVSRSGKYVGDLDVGWWYYKNRMIITERKPNGVAMRLNKKFFLESFDLRNGIPGYLSPFIEGYYGYSHRGGTFFTIGDRLFESDYSPKVKDYKKKEWEKYKRERFNTNEMKRKLGIDGKTKISDVIPFKRRGKKTIKTWEEAEQAAINLSNYLIA